MIGRCAAVGVHAHVYRAGAGKEIAGGNQRGVGVNRRNLAIARADRRVVQQHAAFGKIGNGNLRVLRFRHGRRRRLILGKGENNGAGSGNARIGNRDRNGGGGNQAIVAGDQPMRNIDICGAAAGDGRTGLVEGYAVIGDIVNRHDD